MHWTVGCLISNMPLNLWILQTCSSWFCLYYVFIVFIRNSSFPLEQPFSLYLIQGCFWSESHFTLMQNICAQGVVDLSLLQNCSLYNGDSAAQWLTCYSCNSSIPVFDSSWGPFLYWHLSAVTYETISTAQMLQKCLHNSRILNI